jgi:type II secretory pathway pseudopilin PulG
MFMMRIAGTARRERGLSLVEMMVGITIGLFIVAAASLLVSTQLNDNRRLLLETQVQQDLRATADIIARELRRAGAWSRAETGVWTPATSAAGPARNPFIQTSPSSGSAAAVGFDYSRPGDAGGPYGFKLESGAIKTLLAGAGWQELTDKNVLTVEAFTVEADNSALVRLPCPKACPAPPPPGQAADYCWPMVGVRSFIVTITGRAVSDASVTRTIVSRVRLHNDAVNFNAGVGPNFRACPT